MEGRYSRVHIRVRAEVELGAAIGILGTCRSLGASNEKRAVRLVTTPESYPIWYTVMPLTVPSGVTVYYKYCLIENGDFKDFEALSSAGGSSNNSTWGRSFTADSEDLEVEDTADFASVASTDEATAEQALLKETSANTGRSDEAYKARPFEITVEQNRLILTCYHLPVQIKRLSSGSSSPFEIVWAESLIAKSTNSVSDVISTLWVGTISVPAPVPSDDEIEVLRSMLAAMNCIPIFLDTAVMKDAYYGYCKQVMWPIFHNVDQLDHIHAAWNMYGNAKKEDSKTSGLGQAFNSEEHEKNRLNLEWMKDYDKYFSAYNTVNITFSTELARIVGSGDIVWVHDYHLMLLPKLLRDMSLDIQIVFFLHIPFPTSQIFRALSSASDLLSSMSSADVVGFHAFDHARHFLNASKRMLGIRSHTKNGLLALSVKNREAICTMSHVSIEPDILDKIVADPATQALAKSIRAKYGSKRIIVGVDVCQRLSGVALKLAGFEKLITDNVALAESVVLVQKMLRPSARLQDEESTSEDMKKIVGNLNSRFCSGLRGDGCIVDYEELPKMSLSQRVALFLVADVFLLTPVREGLNQYPLEYIYVRKDLDHAGVVVASEFSTCSSLLSGSIKINPYNALNIADALDIALSMSAVECDRRRQRDIQFVSSHPSSLWTKEILSDLKHLRSYAEGKTKKVNSTLMPDPLITKQVLDAYDSASSQFLSRANRLFVLDYGGTLLHKEKFDVYLKHTLSALSGRKPTDKMMDALRKLSDDPRNCVLVVTGLTKLKLDDVFEGMENISLATSNGLVYSWGKNIKKSDDFDKKTNVGLNETSGDFDLRLQEALQNASLGRRRSDSNTYLLEAFTEDEEIATAGVATTRKSSFSKLNRISYDFFSNSSDNRLWECVDFNIDWKEVRNIAVPITTKFMFRTNGTCLSPRIPGIGWSFFGADPEWGEKQARQLTVELEAALAAHDVAITSQIQGSIEVVPRNLHKGIIVKSLFQHLMTHRANKLPQFVCIIGDEESDDKMFEAFYDVLSRSGSGRGTQDMKAFTVCVGKRETPADWYANDVNDVEMLLAQLASSPSTSS